MVFKPETRWVIVALVVVAVAGYLIPSHIGYAFGGAVLASFAVFMANCWSVDREEFVKEFGEFAPRNARDRTRIEQVLPIVVSVLENAQLALPYDGYSQSESDGMRNVNSKEFLLKKFWLSQAIKFETAERDKAEVDPA